MFFQSGFFYFSIFFFLNLFIFLKVSQVALKCTTNIQQMYPKRVHKPLQKCQCQYNLNKNGI